MEKKNKKELMLHIEEQDKNLQKYKSRLHDIIGSYKNLLAEKETLQNSIKVLTESADEKDSENLACDSEEKKNKNDKCIQQLKNNLGILTTEKSRIENELKADRKKILQQKEEIEKKLSDNETKWLLEKEKYETQILELRKKISIQQREREKEQQDHVLMLKELQNILASERSTKEKLEQQVNEMQQKLSGKLPEKKAVEYEKALEELRSKLRVSQDFLHSLEVEVKKKDILLCKMREENEEIKLQYQSKIEEEKHRANAAEEKLSLLIFSKEKRIASLENRISELSTVVGDHDKIRQQDQITIQKLKARINQLQMEYSAFAHISTDDSKLLQFNEYSDSQDLRPRNETDISYNNHKEIHQNENIHLHCHAELSQLKEELDYYKAKCESALKEKYNKSSSLLLSDAKAIKEIKELKSKVAQLTDQLQSCKSQLKLSEEYHSKITCNLEKACEDLKLLHKDEMTQMEATHKAHLLEFEHQIQKQRERTLLLLEEKDKEIALLKTSFLSSFIAKEKQPENSNTDETELLNEDNEVGANILSHSLISSKKDGHILHYVQELARKDVEISNLRQSRIKSESAVRKLKQDLAAIKEKYFDETDSLKSRIKLLESTQDEEGTNIEYLKNVVLRFLKCTDPFSKKPMINAIATVLHFTNNEIEEIKNYM